MRVIVTGGSGFIGSHVIDLLVAEGCEVHAFSHRAPRRTPDVTWHQVDLLRGRDEVKSVVTTIGATHMIHLAWTAKPGIYQTDRQNPLWTSATIDLAAAFAEAGGQRFVGAGTCAEFDLRFGYMTEGITPIAPTTPYAISKDAARRALEILCRAAGVGFAWGRIFSPYGPREDPKRLTGSIALALLAGEIAAASEGSQIRDFLYVRDVAAAFVALCRSGLEGPVNICSGQPLAVRDFVLAIAGALGRTDGIAFGARPLHMDEPPFLVGDNGRLRRETDWRPRYDLKAGIEESIQWWRAYARNPAPQSGEGHV